MRAIFILMILLPGFLLGAKIPYTVEFIGLNDPATLKTLKSVSDLSSLKERPPASINALRYRAESDIPEMLKVLHAHSYYEATVSIRIEEQQEDVIVFVMIQPGPAYTLSKYTVNLDDPAPCSQITLEKIGIQLGEPALAKKILDAELKVLALLSDCGYPLASVEDREMIADGETKQFSVTLDIKTGPFTRFGDSSITGISSVKPAYINHKIQWKEGDPYEHSKVDLTQKKLMDSGLFSSVLITHGQQIDSSERLPMKIEVSESKHKSVNLGVSYQTFFGPGITFGWENRNIWGMGRRLTLQGDATLKNHSGSATFFVPDCFTTNQDYVGQALAEYESIYAYAERSYSLTNRVEWRIGDSYLVSMGVRVERMLVSESVDNGHFNLLEGPLYFRFSNADHLLNPTRGTTLEYRLIPSINFSVSHKYYFYQTLSHAAYWSLIKTDTLVLAQQIILESILSHGLDSTPVPNRILGGSDQEMRGYRYRTVSPLGPNHRPKGGRSGVFYTLETRFRVNKKIGLVPFFDLGNVYLTSLPKMDGKWLKSVGLGIRYFTFLGPLRFDIAFPLDRRKPIDPRYRILVSLGQTF